MRHLVLVEPGSYGRPAVDDLSESGASDDICLRADALVHVVLQGDAAGHSGTPGQHLDREQAIRDLQACGRFAPVGLTGPFTLRLSLQGGRLLLDVRDGEDRPLRLFVFALSPFRRLIKDYRLLVESYDGAVGEGPAAHLQAIDMGRRALHNEGASLIIERLQRRIVLDFETARRLFTLVCLLHWRH